MTLQHIITQGKVVLGIMHPSVLLALSLPVSHHLIPLTALPAFIHIVILHQSQVLEQVAFSSFKVLCPSIFFQNSALLGCSDLLMVLEFECSAVKLEHFHYSFPLLNTVLQVSILLPVQISFALRGHVVKHVLGEVLQINLEIPWIV